MVADCCATFRLRTITPYTLSKQGSFQRNDRQFGMLYQLFCNAKSTELHTLNQLNDAFLFLSKRLLLVGEVYFELFTHVKKENLI